MRVAMAELTSVEPRQLTYNCRLKPEAINRPRDREKRTQPQQGFAAMSGRSEVTHTRTPKLPPPMAVCMAWLGASNMGKGLLRAAYPKVSQPWHSPVNTLECADQSTANPGERLEHR